MSLHLNIVSFDVPWPADYGGVIDVYHKIRWLHGAGVKVHLHCFAYGRSPSPELEELCEDVHYYPRRTGLLSNFSLLPYTVRSRQSQALRQNLLKNDFPILFEVLHTCFLLKDPAFAMRKKIFRHSNIEHQYYARIARAERGLVRKLFHYLEAWRLQRFEPVVKMASVILAVNEQDTAYFRGRYPSVRAEYVPSFHGNDGYHPQRGSGSFILIHGNLGVAENYEAAIWLLNHVVAGIVDKVIIAGLNPPAFLKAEIERHGNARLVANPSQEEMDKLITDAHIHLLYTSQPTGLKLKLLNVLFKGRFIICNENMLAGTGLRENEGLLVCADGSEFRGRIREISGREFGDGCISGRLSQLERFNNDVNGRKVLAEIA